MTPRALVAPAELVVSRVVPASLSFLPRPGCCLTRWSPTFLLSSLLLWALILIQLLDADVPVYLHCTHADRRRRRRSVFSEVVEQESLMMGDQSSVVGTSLAFRCCAQRERPSAASVAHSRADLIFWRELQSGCWMCWIAGPMAVLGRT